MHLFEAQDEFSMESLARACAPRLKGLLETLETRQLELPLDATPDEVKEERTDEAMAAAGVENLPEDLRPYVSQAVNQLAYDRKKNNPLLGGAFFPLLMPFEQLCGELIRKLLGSRVPSDSSDQRYYFDPYMPGDLKPFQKNALAKNGRLLQKNLVHGANANRIGVTLFCMEYADHWDTVVSGVWEDVEGAFAAPELVAVRPKLEFMNQFRNRHVAHVDEPLTDGAVAEEAMKQWVAGLIEFYGVVKGIAAA
jgi:hypothetical protein